MTVAPNAVPLKAEGYELFHLGLSVAYGFLQIKIASPRSRGNTTSMGMKPQLRAS